MFLPNSFQKCRSSCLQMFFRSSHPEMFCKKAALRDFPKFTGKHLCQSLFITKVGGQGRQFYLKRTLAQVFPVNFAKFGRTPFLTEHLWWLLLVLQNRCSSKFLDIHQKISVLKSIFNTVRGLKAGNFDKKETPTQVFSCEYHKIFKNSCFIEHPWWLLLNMAEEFLIQARYLYRRIYKREICRRSIIEDMKTM